MYPGNVQLQVDPVAAQDPDYLAFMRGAGYSEAEVMADLARRQGQLGRQLDRAAPRFADELRQAETGVKNDFTGRGLYRSGARMVNQVDAGNVVRRNEADFRAGIADQSADMTSDAMKTIAEYRRKAMDQALTSRQTAALNAANSQGVGRIVGRDPGAGGLPPGVGPMPSASYNGPSSSSLYAAFRKRAIGNGVQSRPGTRGPQAL